MNEEKRYLREKELCDRLGISRMMVRRLRAQGMPCLKLGRKIVTYDLEEVMEWFEEHQSEWRRVENYHEEVLKDA